MHLAVIPPSRSLRRKLLLPLLAAGIVVAILAIWLISATAERQLLLRLRLRAELVAHTVNYAAENVSQASDLNRIVSALGAEKQVSLIVVAGGTPARVIASTQNAWMGELVSELPDVHAAEHMGETLGTRKEEGHLHDDRDQYEFRSPLLLSRTDVARQAVSKGAVLVRLEARSTYDEIRRKSWGFAAIFSATVGCLTALGYALLNVHILRPIAALGLYLEDRADAAPRRGPPATADDEIGGFARVLHDALTRTDAVVRELEQQKIELQVLFDLMPAIVCFKDTKNRILRANQRFADAMGMPIGAIEGKSTDELLPEDAARYYVDDLEVIQSGLPSMGIVEMHRDPEGNEMWFQTDRVPCRDQAGKVIGVITMTLDITARRQAEDELRESETRYRSLFENMLEGYAHCRMGGEEGRLWDFTYLEVNSAFESLTGLKNVVGKNIDEIIPGAHEADPALFELYQRVALTGRPERCETYLQSLGIWLSISVYSHEKEHFVAVFDNITERRRAEEDLARSRETLDRVLNQIPQRVFWKDRNLVYRGCNRAFAVDMGFPNPGEVIGKTDFDATWKGVADLYRADDHAVMDANAPKTSFEEPGIAADGEAIWLRTSKTPLHDADGNITGVLGTYEDVTEHKRAKLEIERLNRNLEQRVAQRTQALSLATAEAERANRAKSEFLSRMSHELRTPMNAILGFAQVLETEEDLNAEQRDSVNQILKGGNHLLVLINEVLDITGIESGRLTLSSEPVALAGLLTETISLLRPLSAELQIPIALLAFASAGDHVQADRQRLKQVLLNLLGNALKYNRPGGSVTVRYAAGPGSPATTRLSVTDTGAGLSAAKLARLFNPFDRLGAEQTRVEGTGLGLVLSRRMVEQMGGAIGVESVVGEGSTFWIELPTAEPHLAPEETAADLARVSDAEVSADARVILYIEDNPANLRLVTRILARRPAIRLLCAETGALGLKMAREYRPDLILLDLHLPDYLGTDVLTSLAVDPRTEALPVVMLTADAVAGQREALLSSGARDFITKPLDMQKFLAVVDRLLALETSGAGSL